MTNYKEVIHNIETGEITERPYTDEEIVEVEAQQAERVKRVEAINKAEADKAAAQLKLQALGLTANDLKALGI